MSVAPRNCLTSTKSIWESKLSSTPSKQMVPSDHLCVVSSDKSSSFSVTGVT